MGNRENLVENIKHPIGKAPQEKLYISVCQERGITRIVTRPTGKYDSLTVIGLRLVVSTTGPVAGTTNPTILEIATWLRRQQLLIFWSGEEEGAIYSRVPG
jgi:hypothetical protein